MRVGRLITKLVLGWIGIPIIYVLTKDVLAFVWFLPIIGFMFGLTVVAVVIIIKSKKLEKIAD